MGPLSRRHCSCWAGGGGRGGNCARGAAGDPRAGTAFLALFPALLFPALPEPVDLGRRFGGEGTVENEAGDLLLHPLSELPAPCPAPAPEEGRTLPGMGGPLK